MTSRTELRAMFTLATPLVLSELGWMAMGVVDSMFVGRLGAESLGAISLGTTVFYTVAIIASGLLLGLDTLVAQSWGAGDRADARHSLVNGIWLALLLVPLVMGAVWLSVPLLATFGENPAVLGEGVRYIHALIWSAPPLMIFFALRRYLQSTDAARAILFTLVSANILNAIGNWIFVYGNFGAPRLGAEGAGWATCISRIYMAAALAFVIWQGDHSVARVHWNADAARIKQLLKLGLPAAGQLGLETLVFAAVTMLVGKLSAASLAGHQIALTTVSMTFMMPLGISSAAAVLVGQAVGRHDPRGAAHSGWAALGFGAIAMSAAALALLIFPRAIARLFTPDAAVIDAAIPLLRVAAFFQLFDGLQITATGALRGAGDTRTPMLCHFVGYWVIGLPFGALLCFYFAQGAAGLWIGLSAGLVIIGTALLLFWRHAAQKLQMLVPH